MKTIAELQVGINDWIRAYRRVALYFSDSAPKTAAMERMAYAETIARALFDDIQRGEWGGTYYMDGRAVRENDPDIYGVGGAYPTGITFDKDELDSYIDVMAAIELLREVIVRLQSDSDEPVAIGFWIDSSDDGLCWFDVSNIVRDEDAALSLARKRGEIAIYHFATGEEIRVASKSPSGVNDHGASYARYMRGRMHR